MTPMIDIRDVSFIRDDTTILSGISWHIFPGSRWVLFGANGSGKTTLLELLTGYEWPTSGTIVRLNQDPIDLREFRKHVGYVGMTLRTRFWEGEHAIDVVLSGANASIGIYTPPTDSARERAQTLIAGTGFAHRPDTPFGVCSNGEKQKLLIARALMGEPKLIILDEPAAGLDIGARENLLETIEQVSETNGEEIALVYVTHHIDEISPVFSDILMLDKGQAVFNGAIDKGLTADRLSSLFGRRIDVTKQNGRFFAKPL